MEIVIRKVSPLFHLVVWPLCLLSFWTFIRFLMGGLAVKETNLSLVIIMYAASVALSFVTFPKKEKQPTS